MTQDEKTGLHAPGSATQGVILLTIGQGLFIGFGYVVHLVGTRMLSPVEFGRFVTALSMLNWLQVGLGAIMLPGMSKIVSESPARLRTALGRASIWHWAAALVMGAACFAGAGRIAALMNDPQLTLPLMFVAINLVLFAGFALARALLAAVRGYLASFITIVVFSVVRAGGAVAGFYVANLYFGRGAAGAIAGFGIGALSGSVVGLIFLYWMAKSEREAYPNMVKRSLTWGGFTLPSNLGMTTLAIMDLWFVKALVSDASAAGIYGAAFVTSRLPDIIIMGLVTAVFPKVSFALAGGNAQAARSIALAAYRFALIVFILICAVTAGSSRDIMTLLFGQRYAEGHLLLTLLIFAICLSGMLKLMLTFLTAADRPASKLAFVLGLLPLAVVLNLLLVRAYGPTGAAAAALTTMAAGVVAGGVMVYNMLRILPPWKPVLRCAAAGVVIYAVGAAWPAEKFALIAKLSVLSIVYVLLLAGMGEVGMRDVRGMIKSCIKPKASARTVEVRD